MLSQLVINQTDFHQIVVSSITPLIALGSLILGIYNYIATKRLKQRELQLSFFSEYTKRYQDIMLYLYRSDMPSKEYIRLYLDLCSEEYYLYKQGCLPQDIWEMWLEGMQMIMKQRVFQMEWEKSAGYYNNDFWHFFNNTVLPKQEAKNA